MKKPFKIVSKTIRKAIKEKKFIVMSFKDAQDFFKRKHK